MRDRREFLKDAMAAAVGAARTSALLATEPSRAARASMIPARRVFVASFSHETNTFHPVRTKSFNFSKASDHSLLGWDESEIVVLPGLAAHPAGGGTVEEKPCREAMNRVLSSLREAMPVDAVFLRLHGAMYAEGIGPAESVLVGEIRSMVGPGIPIACTFDLHGNIPARLGQFGDILVGLKTAPHTDGVEIAGGLVKD